MLKVNPLLVIFPRIWCAVSRSREFGGFYGMNYETLMDWIEQGVLTLTPSPQTIAGYLVNYMNNTDFLQKRAITLKEHIWYLFQYDCGQNWTDNRTSGQPYFSFRYFVEHGQLSRMPSSA